jgi:hypothetical protein
VPHYDVHDPGEAFDAHLYAYFAGHEVTRQRWPLGPIEQRIPGFFVYVAGPGPRLQGWTYLTSGCWKATAHHQHGLEFVLSTNAEDVRHIEVLTVLAYYHAGPDSQRLDLGHTAPIGEPWAPGSLCDSVLISLPYAYGPDLEVCSWNAGHIRVLTALPITPAERALKVNQGLEKLEQRLEDTAADFANPLRPSVV